MATYIVAVRRERRADAPADWIETLRTTSGVEVTIAGDGPVERRRVRVRATADGVATLRERLGELCHVEPLVDHRGRTVDGTGDPPRPASDGPAPDEPTSDRLPFAGPSTDDPTSDDRAARDATPDEPAPDDSTER